jgi:hypothetical protein
MKKSILSVLVILSLAACKKEHIYPQDVKTQARADSLKIIEQDSLDNVNDSLNAIQMRDLNKFKSGSSEVYYFPLEGFTHSLEVFIDTHKDLEYVDCIVIYNQDHNGGGLSYIYVEGYTVIFKKK